MKTKTGEKEVRKMILSVYDKLASCAHNLTNNSNDAGDLLQETVLRIIEKKDHFTAGTNFLSWSTAVMRNIFINNYRRQQKEQEVLSIAREAKEEDLENSKNIPLCPVDTEFLFRHIEMLPAHLRKPMLLHLYGYKYNEICEVLSLSMPTVKNRIASARKILQKQLGDTLNKIQTPE